MTNPGIEGLIKAMTGEPNYMAAVKRQGHAHILPQAMSSKLIKQFGTRCLVTAFRVFLRTSQPGSVTLQGNPAQDPIGQGDRRAT